MKTWDNVVMVLTVAWYFGGGLIALIASVALFVSPPTEDNPTGGAAGAASPGASSFII